MDRAQNSNCNSDSGVDGDSGLLDQNWNDKMMRPLYAVHRMRWTIAVAAVIGLTFSAPLIELFYGWYDSFFPILRLEGKVLERAESTLAVSVIGEKLRDCAVVPDSTAAFILRGSTFHDALAERIAGRPSNRPVGPVYLGMWRLSPVPPGSERAVMYVRHECALRHFVTSQVFAVPIPVFEKP